MKVEIKSQPNNGWLFFLDDEPAGYCRGWDACFAEIEEPLFREALEKKHGAVYIAALDEVRRIALPFRTRYHTHKHSTPEEAFSCMRQFLIDQDTLYYQCGKFHMPCQACFTLTNQLVNVAGAVIGYFCGQHQDPVSIRPFVTIDALRSSRG